MKAKLKALTSYLRDVVELEDIGLAVALPAVVVGLWWVYHPAALIITGGAFIGWVAWKQWHKPKSRE